MLYFVWLIWYGGHSAGSARKLGQSLAAVIPDLGKSENQGSVVENYEVAPAYWGDVAAFGTEAGPVGAVGHPTADAEDRALDEFPAQAVSRFKFGWLG